LAESSTGFAKLSDALDRREKMNAGKLPALLKLQFAVAFFALPFLSLAQTGGERPRYPDPDVWVCGALRHPKSDSERSCLQGKVKTVRGERRSVAVWGGRLVEAPAIYFEESYDERGNKTEVVGNNAALSDPKRTIFSFDDKGRPTGNKLFVARSPDPVEVRAYSYDERGNKIKDEVIRPEADQRSVIEYSYDAKGRKTEESYGFWNINGWAHKTVYTYEGNVVRHVIYSKDGAVTGKGVSVYDDDHHLVSEEQYAVAAGGEPTLWRKVSYRYDARGLTVETLYEKAEERLGARAVYGYDERENLKSVTRYRGDGSFIVREVIEYKYDARGSWVERLSSYQRSEEGEPEPFFVERRVITYY
jgi:hypothetical protein